MKLYKVLGKQFEIGQYVNIGLTDEDASRLPGAHIEAQKGMVAPAGYTVYMVVSPVTISKGTVIGLSHTLSKGEEKILGEGINAKETIA